jgi:hypothetical protein
VRLSFALGLASLMPGASAPSRAQDAPQPTLREMVRARQDQMKAASLKDLVRSLPPSLPAVLALDGRQVERLDRLWGDFVLSRLEQEGKIARWQDDLQRAQSPTSFNEGKSRGLLKSIADGQDKIRGTFLKARGEAFKALSPAQRAQVQALASSARPNELPTLQSGSPAGAQVLGDEASGDEAMGSSASGGPTVREDEYRQLLLMPVERLPLQPLDTEAVLRVLAERDHNRYASYGYRSSRYGIGSGRYGFGFAHSFSFGGIYGGFGHRDTYNGHPQHGGTHH